MTKQELSVQMCFASLYNIKVRADIRVASTQCEAYGGRCERPWTITSTKQTARSEASWLLVAIRQSLQSQRTCFLHCRVLIDMHVESLASSAGQQHCPICQQCWNTYAAFSRPACLAESCRLSHVCNNLHGRTACSELEHLKGGVRTAERHPCKWNEN